MLTVLLKLIEKGGTREDAYQIVQSSAMNVWHDKLKTLKDELQNSDTIKKYLTEKELDEIFNPDSMLKNVDYL